MRGKQWREARHYLKGVAVKRERVVVVKDRGKREAEIQETELTQPGRIGIWDCGEQRKPFVRCSA